MSTGQQAEPQTEPQTAMRIDPVCGMRVVDRPEAPHATFDHVAYVFCSEECRWRFLAHPERYVSAIAFEPGRHATG